MRNCNYNNIIIISYCERYFIVFHNAKYVLIMSAMKRFSWEYYASVEDISKKFKLSKRRIQQVLVTLRNENKLEIVVGVYPDPSNPIGFSIKPLYRRLK